jgi:AcrR family transcriptional regulator
MHFRDKGEMLLEICEGAFSELIARNTAILAEPCDAAERVRRMLDAYLDFALANPNAYWLVFDRAANEATAGHDEAIGHSLGKQCYAVFQSAVADLGAAGRLHQPDPDLTAQALWAATHGLASLLITKSGFPWADPVAVRGVLLDGLFRGLVR